jgi:hypothetical protein
MMIEFMQYYEGVVKDVRINGINFALLLNINCEDGLASSLDGSNNYFRWGNMVEFAQLLQCKLSVLT